MAALSPVQAACGVQGARQVAGRSVAAAPVSGFRRVTARGPAFTGGSVRLSSKTRGCVGALRTGEKSRGLQEAKQQRSLFDSFCFVFFSRARLSQVPPLLLPPLTSSPIRKEGERRGEACKTSCVRGSRRRRKSGRTTRCIVTGGGGERRRGPFEECVCCLFPVGGKRTGGASQLVFENQKKLTSKNIIV